jgi:hypothetical protein
MYMMACSNSISIGAAVKQASPAKALAINISPLPACGERVRERGRLNNNASLNYKWK